MPVLQVAESEDRAEQVGRCERQKILSLGNRYNSLSTACLQTLVGLGCLDKILAPRAAPGGMPGPDRDQIFIEDGGG